VEAQQGRLMGRKPSKPGAIPRFRARPQKSGATFYYYDHGGKPRKETPLGSDYGLAIKKWAELEHATDIPTPAIVTFRHVADGYRRHVIPTKAARTQRDNLKELAKLVEFFNDPPAPLDAISGQHVQQYLKWRRPAMVRAQREKALLSHLWNWAIGEGYTEKPNPCAGMRAKGSKGRDAYIEDDQYAAIWGKAGPCLRDAMDLAYLTGQRPADVLRMDERDVRDEVLRVRQGKTGTKVRIGIADSLPVLLERIRARKAGFKVHCTRLVVNQYGRPIGVNALSRQWALACKAAKVEGLQFRDLRAKAATDKEESTGNIRDAQRQMGHANVSMTEHYTRNRKGAKSSPTRELRSIHAIAERADDAEGEKTPANSRG
jgi:integrase